MLQKKAKQCIHAVHVVFHVCKQAAFLLLRLQKHARGFAFTGKGELRSTHTHTHTHTHIAALKDNILSPLYCDKEVEGGATECDNRTWFFFIYIINVCDSE